jgi:hypothetical protein
MMIYFEWKKDKEEFSGNVMGGNVPDFGSCIEGMQGTVFS